MKNYKDFEKIYIGSSDIASLTLRSPQKAYILNFGEDGTYSAYLVTDNAEIGKHYELCFTCDTWLNIYDDDGLVKTINAELIEVYRAGEMGCIIVAKNNPIVKNEWGYEIEYEVAVSYMDEELREKLHSDLSPCFNQTFFDIYAIHHKEKFGEEWECAKKNPVF